MEHTLTGSCYSSISDGELFEIVCWLKRWQFVDPDNHERIVMAYGDHEVVEKLNELEDNGAVQSWRGHEVIEYPEIPDSVFLVVVARPCGNPGKIVLWEANLERDELYRRLSASQKDAEAQKELLAGPTVSKLIIYTMMAQCVLEDLDA